MNNFLKYKYIILIFFSISMVHPVVLAEKIRNLINISNTNQTQLLGYGLVIGLNGTGDQITPLSFAKKLLINIFLKFGINIDNNYNTQTRNIAAVIVTAITPPFNYIGQKINVSVSSVGNATNLHGGLLLLTPLYGLDKKKYAVAYGKVSCISNQLHTTNLYNTNYYTNVEIKNGAVLEKKILSHDKKNQNIFLYIQKKDSALTQEIYRLINNYYPNHSKIIDIYTIQITLPENKLLQLKILSHIENMDVDILKLH
ncbi:flagellar P-ring protein precursor [Buchnera aphidicola (Cinara tujafilina)]|uniref:Flagellar P-ring protein n=1 Tax=Buchnera aphidicola (Cinara tujafilina) TaxID=261317 RepID=F7WZE5_9GAMM|nr:flagellar basal body P-ring protein FlgI [Buchnera aphidicola]AEH39807.1 flagellar P-ring protein precursor [Buchnera aphidicola (Cinara tujafilina)]